MIVAGLQIFEEIDFIEPCIRSCCETFDAVVAVEGSWTTTAKIRGERSSDGTIEKIEDLQQEYDNLELVFYNGINQSDHRQFIWECCKKYNPDWYLQGDGDEIFHEKYVKKIRDALSYFGQMDSVAPMHYLFWHDLNHYEFWNTAGARFFNVSGLDYDKIKGGNPQCNDMTFDNKRFRRNSTEDFYIYHPSYVKNPKRQELKIKHRSKDNGSFPHVISGDKIYRGNVKDVNAWLESLHTINTEQLPRYLQ